MRKSSSRVVMACVRVTDEMIEKRDRKKNGRKIEKQESGYEYHNNYYEST